MNLCAFRLVVLCAIAAPLGGQDLHFAQLQWLNADDPPDTLPVAKELRAGRPAAGLREISDPHYAEFRFLVTEAGQRELIAAGSSTPWLDWKVEERFYNATFEPAQRDGRPVSSEVMAHLIYNPASADEDRADATPRLLQVVPPRMPQPDNPEASPADSVVPVHAVVGVEGRVVSAEAVPTADRRYARAAEAAVRHWRFAPARRAGQPVEAGVLVPVVFKASPEYDEGAVQVRPKVRSQTRPVYPVNMHQASLGGEVVVTFVVTVEGRVRNAYAARSNNPGFDEAAVEAVEKWTFEPGRVNGRAVNTRMQVPIVFQIQGGSRDAFFITKPRKWKKEVPEHLQFDEPPKLLNMALPNYPREALLAGVSGKVTVGFLIGPDGKVRQAAVAIAAVEAFEFKPALREGRHSFAAVRITLNFRRNGSGDAPVSPEDRRLLRVLEKAPHELVPLARLDFIPAARSRRPPVFPLGTRVAGAKGEARIEFIIDRKGFARLPRVLEASDPAFGYAAMHAVSTWRFETPRVADKPVDALAVIPIRFGPE